MHAKNFIEFSEVFGLHQIVEEPTRISNFSSTLIDFILVTDPSLVLNKAILDMHGISDHRLVHCMLDYKVQKLEQFLLTYR